MVYIFLQEKRISHKKQNKKRVGEASPFSQSPLGLSSIFLNKKKTESSQKAMHFALGPTISYMQGTTTSLSRHVPPFSLWTFISLFLSRERHFAADYLLLTSWASFTIPSISRHLGSRPSFKASPQFDGIAKQSYCLPPFFGGEVVLFALLVFSSFFFFLGQGKRGKKKRTNILALNS